LDTINIIFQNVLGVNRETQKVLKMLKKGTYKAMRMQKALKQNAEKDGRLSIEAAGRYQQETDKYDRDEACMVFQRIL